MKSLIQIVNILKPKETRVIKKMYEIRSNGEDKKRLKLFELILSGKVKTDEEAAYALYKSKPNSAFSHIKRRLKKDILNHLLIQDASKHYSNRSSQADLECRKMTLYGELLLRKGIYDEGERILSKALDIAIEFELYPEVLRIKHLLRTTLGFRKGIEAYEEYSSNIEYYFTEFGKWLKAREYYNKIMLPNQFNTNKKDSYIDFGRRYLSELQQLHTQDSGVYFTFYYYLTTIYYYNILRNFDISLDYAKRQLHLVQGTKILNTPTNYAGINMVLSNIQINLGDFDEAIEYATIAVNHFRKGMINELRALEFLFFGYLRKQDYDSATNIIEQGIKHKQIKSNELLKARWLFFKANLEYLKGDFDAAFQLLRKNKALLKDKSGWLIGFKLLEMMLTTEEKDLYWLSFQLNNFNHLLSRKQHENVHRAKIIAQVLRAFLKYGGNFALTLEKAAEKINMLTEGEGDLYWDPKGYEVIRFDQWLRSKTTNRRPDAQGGRVAGF